MALYQVLKRLVICKKLRGPEYNPPYSKGSQSLEKLLRKWPRQALRELVLQSWTPISETCASSVLMLSQICRAFNCISLFFDVPDGQEITLCYRLAHGYGRKLRAVLKDS